MAGYQKPHFPSSNVENKTDEFTYETWKPGCKVCTRVFEKKETGFWSVASLTPGIEQGCKICPLVHKAVSEFWPSAALRDWSDPNRAGFSVNRGRLSELELDSATKVQIFTSLDEETRHPLFPALESKVEDSGSEAGIDKVKKWYRTCMKRGHGHERCNVRSEEMLFPDRLVQVRAMDGSDILKLVETNDERGYYTTLSHCWGHDPKYLPPSTTTENFGSHKLSLEWESLSKTFQDAITITRALDIRYIWIDSLCIIQDDKGDWLKQAPQMGSIYFGAALTIVAARALHGGVGVFSHRKIVRLGSLKNDGKECNIYARVGRGKHFVKSAIAGLNINRDSTDRGKNPLYQRGWALQERYMSSRLLQYEDFEMTWECRTSYACECTGYWSVSELNFFDRLEATRKAASLHKRRRLWWDLVEMYTKTQLTIDSDMLPALSSLASACASLGCGKYLAGLWEEDLIASLCWSAVGKGTRSLSYIAPSFSWASRQGPVVWDFPLKVQGFESVPVAHISEIQTTTHEEYVFGEVSCGYLELEGTLVPAQFVKNHPILGDQTGLMIQGQLYDERGFRLDVQDEDQYTKDVACMPLLNIGRWVGADDDPEAIYLVAIVLAKEVGAHDSGATIDIYRRIGLLSHFNLCFKRAWFEEQPQTKVRIV